MNSIALPIPFRHFGFLALFPNILALSVHDEDYSSNVPDEDYSSNVPGEGYSSNVPDEDYSRNASCALHFISTFLFNRNLDMNSY